MGTPECATCGGTRQVPGMVMLNARHGAGWGVVPCPDCKATDTTEIAPVDAEQIRQALNDDLAWMSERRNFGTESDLLATACAAIHTLMTVVVVLADHVQRLEGAAQ